MFDTLILFNTKCFKTVPSGRERDGAAQLIDTEIKTERAGKENKAQ